MTRSTRAAVAVAVALLSALVATDNRADTVTKKNGSTIEGRIVAETADAVTVEADSGGITFRQKISRANIRSIEREVRDGPGYCTIPLTGDFGGAIRADDVRAAVAEARRLEAKYVVLVIDSPGGSILEMNQVIQVFTDNADLTFVAYVKTRALSAAAVTALACPHIVMAPKSSIGASVVFTIGPDGTPRDIEEKFRAAMRANLRAAAGVGGRSDLWVRGMSETDLEIAVVKDEKGKPKLVEGPAPDGGAVIKAKGRILAVTATEAADAGLSDATVAGVEGVREVLGLAAWHNAGDGPAGLMTSRVKLHAEDRAAGRGGPPDPRLDRLQRLQPQMDELKARSDRAMAEVAAADRAAIKARADYEQGVARINAEVQATVAQGGSAGLLARARGRDQAEELRQQCNAEITRQQAIRLTALNEARDIAAQAKRLILTAVE